MKGILLDDTTGDIAFSGNDLAVGNIDMQTVQTILQANAGEIKEKPTLGVGIHRVVKAPRDPFLSSRVKENLKVGNIECKSVKINSEKNEIIIEL